MLNNPARSIATCVIALFLLAAPALAQTADSLGEDVSIAVLPFEVNAGDDLSYLRDSLPELLSDRLSEAGFIVIDAEAMAAALEGVDVANINPDAARDVAKRAGAEFAVYGTLNQIGDSLNLDASLVDALESGSGKRISVSKDGLINLLPAVDSLVDRMRMNLLRQDVVAEVDVAGTQVLDKEVVLMRMTLQKGDVLTAKTINTALKNVYDLGYFDDVKVRLEDVEDGKRVVFDVKEKPRIQAVTVRGAEEIDPDDILEAVSTKKGGVVNPKVLSDDIRVIREMYRKEGYYKAKVTHEVVDDGNGVARMAFIVDEGPELYIENVVIDGAEQIDPDDVKDVLALKERGFLSWIDDSGVLKEELLERDAAAIMAFYQSKGFLTAKVGRPEVDIKDDGIDVIYKVWEGDRYKMGQTLFKGDLIDEPAKLLEVTNIDALHEEDEYFDRTLIKDDIDALTTHYNNYGYAYADVGVKLQDNAETKIVDVVYNIEKHQRVHIRRVLIEGNARTRDNVIMREMRLADGDRFHGEKLQRSHQRLTNLDYFEKVDISPVPTGNPEEMDLVVKVKDKSTGSISGGIGYSTYDGVFFGGTIKETNLFGRGYTVGFEGMIGGSSTLFTTYFTNPHINDTDLGFGVNVHKSDKEYSQYEIASTGGDVNFSYPLGEYTTLKWGYGLSFYSIYDVESDASEEVKDDEGDHTGSVLSSSITRDTRDRFMGTTKGTRTTFKVAYGGGAIGGTDHFVKYTGSYDYYVPVLEKVVFHSKFWGGYVHENFNNDEIPTAQRFELGGVDSIRGYSNYSIVPTESADSSSTVGGNKGFYTNLELKRPLSEELGITALVFFDAGNSWQEDEMFFEPVERYGKTPALGLYKSVGAGLNWYSPMGPVGFVYGYALDDLDNSSRHKVEFLMGRPF